MVKKTNKKQRKEQSIQIHFCANEHFKYNNMNMICLFGLNFKFAENNAKNLDLQEKKHSYISIDLNWNWKLWFGMIYFWMFDEIMIYYLLICLCIGASGTTKPFHTSRKFYMKKNWQWNHTNANHVQKNCA